jgi:hypothetical protein
MSRRYYRIYWPFEDVESAGAWETWRGVVVVVSVVSVVMSVEMCVPCRQRVAAEACLRAVSQGTVQLVMIDSLHSASVCHHPAHPMSIFCLSHFLYFLQSHPVAHQILPASIPSIDSRLY